MDISPSAQAVLERRYFAPGEDWSKLCRRVAHHISTNSGEPDPEWTEEAYYDLLLSRKFLPNSPTLMNAGRDLGQLSACFVLEIQDSMESIFDTMKQAAIIHKSGGGTGFDFSQLRPRGDIVQSTQGVASGPVSFLRAYDAATESVKQGGTRRGANMAVLRCDHPDIMEFIGSKRDGTSLANFNISVALTNSFMEMLEQPNGAIVLENPRQEAPPWDETMACKGIWDALVQAAWETGDPGLVFIDRINEDHPNKHLGDIASVNPCGEQPLLPNESCNLGSINLSKFVGHAAIQPYVMWDQLKETIWLAVRFLDGVVSANRFPSDDIRRETLNTRRIGVGVMGWADMLIQMSLPYSSPEALTLAESLSKFIREEAMSASQELAQEKGPYPAWAESLGTPEIRNTSPYTLAPTGTISIIAECSSGIEPLFALAYTRNVMDHTLLTEIYQPLMDNLAEHFFPSAVEDIKRQISEGTPLREVVVPDGQEIIDELAELYVTAHEIAPESHVRMQAAWQKYVPNAVSKTVNLPHDATPEDIDRIYRLAWELGCKGITAFRDGSKGEQVLTVGTQANQQANESARRPKESKAVVKKPFRPFTLLGRTDRLQTAHGTLYLTINHDGETNPVEVFGALGKNEPCQTATLNAICRMASIALRYGVPLEEVIGQLQDLECCPFYHDGHLFRSIPDAIAQALGGYRVEGEEKEILPEYQTLSHRPQPRCPECPYGYLVIEGGCPTCYACGYSKC